MRNTGSPRRLIMARNMEPFAPLRKSALLGQWKEEPNRVALLETEGDPECGLVHGVDSLWWRSNSRRYGHGGIAFERHLRCAVRELLGIIFWAVLFCSENLETTFCSSVLILENPHSMHTWPMSSVVGHSLQWRGRCQGKLFSSNDLQHVVLTINPKDARLTKEWGVSSSRCSMLSTVGKGLQGVLEALLWRTASLEQQPVFRGPNICNLKRKVNCKSFLLYYAWRKSFAIYTCIFLLQPAVGFKT